MGYVQTAGVVMPGYLEQNLMRGDLLIDATGEKIALIGKVWNSAHATKNITKVGFLFGAVTKSGGSGLTVSLQDVDLVNGPPFRPDGTQDQTVAIANSNAAFAAFGWIQTGAFSVSRTVAFGEALAVVIEYDGAGRLGADTVTLSTASTHAATATWLASGAALFTASWALNSLAEPIIILEFDDGTFGTLTSAFPLSGFTSLAYASNSAADEAALRFTVPFRCKIDGAWMLTFPGGATSDFDIVLYEGTTALATVSYDANAVAAASVRPLWILFPSEIALTPGTVYYLSLKPTTTNNVTICSFDVNAAAHFEAHAGGTSWHYASRVDAGAWTPITTRRPLAGIRISALDDGAPMPTYQLGM